MNRTGRLVLTGLAATGVLATGSAAVAAGVVGTTAPAAGGAAAQGPATVAVDALRDELDRLDAESRALEGDLARAAALLDRARDAQAVRLAAQQAAERAAARRPDATPARGDRPATSRPGSAEPEHHGTTGASGGGDDHDDDHHEDENEHDDD